MSSTPESILTIEEREQWADWVGSERRFLGRQRKVTADVASTAALLVAVDARLSWVEAELQRIRRENVRADET